jgi:hypothetical protein
VRTCFSLLAIVAAIAYAEPAFGDTPPDVYSDFAEDGVLSCDHSKSAMKGILNDASLYQYGDPLTFLQLKLAIRRQLAGGCRRQRAAAEPGGSASGGTATTDPAVGTEPTTRADKNRRQAARSALDAQSKGRTQQSDDVERGGEMMILGAGLLLLALGSGGWAAKRAFAN